MTTLERLISIPRRNTDDDAWQARMEARLAAQHARAVQQHDVRVTAYEAGRQQGERP